MNSPTGRPQRLVLVIGAGRSGTSLFSRWLDEIGLNFGADVDTVEHINPDGNYEDATFMDLQIDLLKANGHDRWLDVPHGAMLAVPDAFANRIQDTARHIATIPSPAALKNPLASSFLALWDDMLGEPDYVFVFRDAAQMAQSVVRLRQRNQHNRRNRLAGLYRRLQYRLDASKAREDEKKALETWARINDECLRFLRTLDPDRVIVVDAARWADDAAAIADHLGRRLDFTPHDVNPADLIRTDYFNRTATAISGPADLVARVNHTTEELQRALADLGPHRPRPSD